MRGFAEAPARIPESQQLKDQIASFHWPGTADRRPVGAITLENWPRGTGKYVEALWTTLVSSQHRSNDGDVDPLAREQSPAHLKV